MRKISEVEIAKYKAAAENASKNSLDYASLHGYESWMQALQSAQEEARNSKERQREAEKHTSYVVEELKRMTMYKERAELETKQVMLQYGGLTMKQLIFPAEMNIEEAQNLLQNPVKEEHASNSAQENSSSFFSSFRRKLKEKFSSLTQKQDGSEQSSEDAALDVRAPLAARPAQVPATTKRIASASASKPESSPLAGGQFPAFSKTSPQNSKTTQRRNTISPTSIGSLSSSPKHLPTTPQQHASPNQNWNTTSDEPQLLSASEDRQKSSSSALSRMHNRQNEFMMADEGRLQLMRAKTGEDNKNILQKTSTRAEHKTAVLREPIMHHHSAKGFETDQHLSIKTDSQSSRPSSADSGSMSSSRDLNDVRLPAQYQMFRARQFNPTIIPKLSFSTPRSSDSAGSRYQMRRDVTITDPSQCLWLQRASGPISERCVFAFVL